MGLRERLRGDPSLTPAERRARVRAVWRDPRLLVPWSVVTSALIVLTGRDGDEPWPVLLLLVLVGAVVCGAVMTAVNRALDQGPGPAGRS